MKEESHVNYFYAFKLFGIWNTQRYVSRFLMYVNSTFSVSVNNYFKETFLNCVSCDEASTIKTIFKGITPHRQLHYYYYYCNYCSCCCCYCNYFFSVLIYFIVFVFNVSCINICFVNFDITLIYTVY